MVRTYCLSGSVPDALLTSCHFIQLHGEGTWQTRNWKLREAEQLSPKHPARKGESRSRARALRPGCRRRCPSPRPPRPSSGALGRREQAWAGPGMMGRTAGAEESHLTLSSLHFLLCPRGNVYTASPHRRSTGLDLQ